ncbi:hypothetical protein C0995_004868 [Termitomyces sp. Mi166|nr:hypothetical protein C0995_004868 [Termitomyces sp. Mi166\
MDMKWLFYTSLGLVADALDLVLTSATPNQRPQRSIAREYILRYLPGPSDVDQLNDKEILELIKNAPRLIPKYNVFKLTPNVVAKRRGLVAGLEDIDATEANVLNLLFAETTIPVPRVRRVVNSWIVMDYIPGTTLAQAWPSLSIWRKIRIAFTLRRYVRQLRQLKASATTPPGPFSARGPQICESPIFGGVQSTRGPFTSYSEFSQFFNKRHKMSADNKKIPPEDPKRKERFDDTEPLVLTHQDLNLRNIMVGEDGRLWMIDWAWSGYYPVWFEYVTMQIQNEYEKVSGTNDKFWKVLIPFIFPEFQKQSTKRNSLIPQDNADTSNSAPRVGYCALIKRAAEPP